MNQVSKSHETYGELFRKVETNRNDLQSAKDEEMKKISEGFRKMRMALDAREAEFKVEFEDKVREHFRFMNKESIKLRYIFEEIDKIYQNINKLQELLERFDEYTVVGSTQKIRLMDQSYQLLSKKLLNQFSVDLFYEASNPKLV